MDADAILERMRAYFEGKQPEEVIAGLAGQSPRVLLKESLDFVDFIVYLEEEVGRDIPLNQIGEGLLNRTFGELAGDLARLLSEG